MARGNFTSILFPVALLCSSPLLLGSAGFRANFNDRLLAAQNSARAELGVGPLQWNPQLAEDAKIWADELAETGKFEHSPDEPGADEVVVLGKERMPSSAPTS